MKIVRKYSLKSRITRHLLGFGLLLTFVLTSATFYFGYKNDLERLDSQFYQIETSFLNGVVSSVWALDKSLAQIQVQGITELPNFSYAFVESEGRVFVSSGIMPDHNSLIKHSYPLKYKAGEELINIGELTVVADLSGIQSHIVNRLIRLLVVLSGLMLFLMYLLSYLINNLLLKHLDQLSRFMRRTEQNNIEERFVLDRPEKNNKEKIDELDVLVDAFNFQNSQIHQFDEELRDSEERLSKVFESSPDAIIVSKQQDGMFIDVNKAFERLFGYSKMEAIGRTGVEQNIWIKPESRAVLLQELIKTGSVRYHENQFRRKDGKIRDCVVSCEAISLNDSLCIVSTFRDTTEQKAMQRAVYQSEQKFSRVFSASPYPIVICQFEDGALLEVNQAAINLFGYHRQYLIGRVSLGLSTWVNAEERNRVVGLLLKFGRVREMNIDFRTRNSNTLHCQLSANTAKLGSKRIVIAIIRDISKRRKAEHELLESRQRLRNLAHRLEEIREEERTGIARELHDELGQSLTGLKIDLTAVLNERVEKNKMLGLLNSMIKNIDGMVDVVRKISSELRPSVLDDLGLVAAIEWLTKDFSERLGIDYDLNINCKEPDPNKARDTAVFRIYQEALVNIARHSEADFFWVDLRIVDNQLLLNIIDNGIGITISQLNDSRSIGLIGMKERATHVGGTIHVHNRDEGGVKVKLVVPIFI